MGFGIRILIKGPRACFTRPEMKAERVSYDVLTPSAARGIIEAVYWKPAIRWRVDSIGVLNEICFDSFRRNELESKLSYSEAKKAMTKDSDVYVAASEKRQQRATTYLRDVAYLVKGHFELTEKAGPDDTVEKHYNIALRRFRKGQCFNQPVLGCREFPAQVELIESEDEWDRLASVGFYAGSGERDLGFMLYDIDFAHGMEPMFYRAVMHDGVIDTRFENVGVMR